MEIYPLLVRKIITPLQQQQLVYLGRRWIKTMAAALTPTYAFMIPAELL